MGALVTQWIGHLPAALVVIGSFETFSLVPIGYQKLFLEAKVAGMLLTASLVID